MAYQEGDTSPPHTNVHNEVREQLDELSTEFEIPVVLPPVVGLGDVGHVDHHNLFTDAIAELSKFEGGLKGYGGWAEITKLTGMPKRYAYNDGPGGVGGVDWVAFEWTDSTEPSPNSLTTLNGGLVDVLMISCGGMGDGSNAGAAGRVRSGLHTIGTGEQNIIIGRRGGPGESRQGFPSYLGDLCSYASPGYGGAAGATSTDTATPEGRAGFPSAILGFDETFGTSCSNSFVVAPRPNKGDGGPKGQVGSEGVVIVRVPAAQAAGVDPGSWVTRTAHYAEVIDGIVTGKHLEHYCGDGTITPLPKDTLIECDAGVDVGWLYADGEFTPPPPPPPPTREELIEALQEKINALQKDTK